MSSPTNTLLLISADASPSPSPSTILRSDRQRAILNLRYDEAIRSLDQARESLAIALAWGLPYPGNNPPIEALVQQVRDAQQLEITLRMAREELELFLVEATANDGAVPANNSTAPVFQELSVRRTVDGMQDSTSEADEGSSDEESDGDDVWENGDDMDWHYRNGSLWRDDNSEGWQEDMQRALEDAMLWEEDDLEEDSRTEEEGYFSGGGEELEDSYPADANGDGNSTATAWPSALTPPLSPLAWDEFSISLQSALSPPSQTPHPSSDLPQHTVDEGYVSGWGDMSEHDNDSLWSSASLFSSSTSLSSSSTSLSSSSTSVFSSSTATSLSPLLAPSLASSSSLGSSSLSSSSSGPSSSGPSSSGSSPPGSSAFTNDETSESKQEQDDALLASQLGDVIEVVILWFLIVGSSTQLLNS